MVFEESFTYFKNIDLLLFVVGVVFSTESGIAAQASDESYASDAPILTAFWFIAIVMGGGIGVILFILDPKIRKGSTRFKKFMSLIKLVLIRGGVFGAVGVFAKFFYFALDLGISNEGMYPLIKVKSQFQ